MVVPSSSAARWITADHVRALAAGMGHSAYTEYLERILTAV